MRKSAILGWDTPDLTDVADAPEGFDMVAREIEATMSDKTLTQFTPRWVSTGRYQPSNPLINIGFFTVRAGLCDIAVFQAYGPVTSGGSGELAIELPYPTAWPYEQWVTAKTFIPGLGRIIGLGLINARQVVQPLFPTSGTGIGLGHWRSTVDPIAAGSGVPTVPGTYTVHNGANFTLTGRYRISG